MSLGLSELLILFCVCGLLALLVIGGLAAGWALFIRPKSGKQQ
jgi:hypothetical protein